MAAQARTSTQMGERTSRFKWKLSFQVCKRMTNTTYSGDVLHAELTASAYVTQGNARWGIGSRITLSREVDIGQTIDNAL